LCVAVHGHVAATGIASEPSLSDGDGGGVVESATETETGQEMQSRLVNGVACGEAGSGPLTDLELGNCVQPEFESAIAMKHAFLAALGVFLAHMYPIIEGSRGGGEESGTLGERVRHD
jgi:hypothetical protein